MSSADKYGEGSTPGASTIDIQDSTYKSTDRIANKSVSSKDNLMIEKCEFDKKTCAYTVLVIIILAVAAVAGVVASMFTIANLQTFNIPVDHGEINLANVLISRDKVLVYLPQFPDGSIEETQTISDQATGWMAVVNRPGNICFLHKADPTKLFSADVIKGITSAKRDLKISFTVVDNQWATRRLTEEEGNQVGGFIWDSCAAKEVVVMEPHTAAPVSAKCETFCLPHYTVTAGESPHLDVSAVNCVPARCENTFK